ncbi:leucine-rich repeat receptor-like protein kinasePXL2 [Striga asiatica]|uniref:Leucine-rich repeat receptor-like protein kinasePXL2 n=1 Tax=Striga asiatica TaxID=4170 RepID=A0A5A7PS22_STRAF|nr:leucine-rich repeat receptor-like protein kinasePXL2 [Striga asiatica]
MSRYFPAQTIVRDIESLEELVVQNLHRNPATQSVPRQKNSVEPIWIPERFRYFTDELVFLHLEPRQIKQLAELSTNSMAGLFPMSLSTAPLNMLLERSIELYNPKGKEIGFSKNAFKFPERLFEWRSRSAMRTRFLNSTGTEELKLLLDKFRKESFVRFPIHEGSVPLRELLDKSRTDREENEDRLLGSSPSSPVLASNS